MSDIRDTPLGLAYELLGEFVAVSEAERIMLTTWAAATRVFREFPAFARLDVSADGMGCGKTNTLEATLALCPEPIVIAQSTPAAVKAWIDEHPNATVGLDERDLLTGTTGRKSAGADLGAILNAGYARDGSVMAQRGGHPVMIPVYGAMAHGGIGRAAPTLVDRSVTITLRKSTPSSVWLSVIHAPILHRAGADIAAWLNGGAERARITAAPNMADLGPGANGIPRDPRHRLKLAPLAAVADLAGILPEWLDAEREITTGLVARPMPSRAEMLLDALRGAGALGSLLTADDIRIMAPANVVLAMGRVGDLEIAGLMRSVGIESTAGGAGRGYRIR